MLADPNYKDFESRLTRITKARRKGYGFEAAGTLGRSSTYKHPRSFGRILRGTLIVLAMAWVMKGIFYFYVGGTAYEQRVAQLRSGTELDPIAATLMAADPVTKLIAGFIGEVLPQFK